MTRFLLSIGTALVFVAALAHADDDGMTALYPAPLPSPALKNRLLPEFRTQTAGDALPLYLDAFEKYIAVFNQLQHDQPYNSLGKLDKWSTMPPAELPRKEVRKTLESFKDVLDLVNKAARCERCTGGAAEGTVTPYGFGQLPRTYFPTEIVTLLAVRARLEMADGDLTAALHSMQTGFAMARHFGELPGIAFAMSGATAADIMLLQVEAFVQQPKAPNLYWALADLPRPLIDWRASLAAERIALYGRFPGAAEAHGNLDAGPMTEEQIQSAVKLVKRYIFVRGPQAFYELQQGSELTKRLTANYEENKAVLLQEGRSRENVERLPHVQVAILAAFGRYERTMDEQIKWFNEPFDQAAEHLYTLSMKYRNTPQEKKLYPIVPVLVVDLLRSRIQLERKIDALRCIESIRAYAVGYDGKLPPSLHAIKDVPLPRDPLTHKAFVYKFEGETATLETPELTRENRRGIEDINYQMLMRQP